MLLVRIPISGVAKHWDLIKGSISEAFPPTCVPDEKGMLSVLQQILAGGMQVWACLRNRYPVEAVALLTTYIATEPITGTKSLLLFSLYAWEPLQRQDYLDGFETMKKYALSEGCTNISYYTANSLFSKLAQEVGFNTQFNFGVLHLT